MAKSHKQIHRLKDAYKKLLDKSRKIYQSMALGPDNRCELVSAGNCYLYSYSETGGRNHRDVFLQTQNRFEQLSEMAYKKEVTHGSK